MIFPNLFLNLSLGKRWMLNKSKYLYPANLDLNGFFPYFCGLYLNSKIQVQNLQVPLFSFSHFGERIAGFKNP